MHFRFQFKTTLIITHNGEELKIPQGKGVTFNAKEGIDLEHFQILEEYINGKPLSFQEDLFNAYKESVQVIRSKKRSNITDIDQNVLFNILNLFDMDDFISFVYTLGLVPPAVFENSFEEKAMKDELRTYTITQYFEFIALIHLMSSVSPILSMLVLFHDVSKKMAIVTPFDLLTQHPVMKTRAGLKYLNHVKAIFNKTPSDMILISRNMSEDDMLSFMACTTLAGKLAIHNIFEDVSNKNIVTRMHQTISGKISTSGYFERNLSSGTNTDDKLSTFDGVRRYYSITGGIMEEFMFITEDPYVFANQYGKLDGVDGKKNRKLLDLGLKAVKNNVISDGVIGLVASVVKNYINPAAIEIIGERSVRSPIGPSPIEVVLATGFMLTYETFPEIGTLLVSHKLTEEDGVVLETKLMGRTKIKTSIIEDIFPASKVNGPHNFIVEALNKIDESISKDRLLRTVGEGGTEIVVSLDFKMDMLMYFKWCNERKDKRVDSEMIKMV
jgi:hypothetical protein